MVRRAFCAEVGPAMVDYPSLFIGFALGVLAASLLIAPVWIINNMRIIRWIGKTERGGAAVPTGRN